MLLLIVCRLSCDRRKYWRRRLPNVRTMATPVLIVGDAVASRVLRPASMEPEVMVSGKLPVMLVVPDPVPPTTSDGALDRIARGEGRDRAGGVAAADLDVDAAGGVDALSVSVAMPMPGGGDVGGEVDIHRSRGRTVGRNRIEHGIR